MTWWEWTIAAVWGPTTVATAGMLLLVLMEKVRDRVRPTRPVLVDRRLPQGAVVRGVVDGHRRGRLVAVDQRQPSQHLSPQLVTDPR